MILRRLILALAGAAALAASAAVLVVALAFGLYALVEPWVGRAGAAGIVAAAAAALIALAALVVLGASRRRRRKLARDVKNNPLAGVMERGMNFVREQPVVAIAAALGAGFLAIRNPRYLGSAIRAFVEGPEER